VTADDIAYIAQLCRTRAGLRLAADKPYLIESRLAPVARREGLATVEALIATVRERREEPLIWGLVEALAAGESAFFRDRAPFATFRDELLAQLAPARAGQPVRVWSAACGTGQEIYSLALVVDELMRSDASLRVELAASDLSRHALERAQAGLYTQFEAQRGLPIRLLAGHFEKDGDAWRIAARLRDRVKWRRINLIASLRGIGRFDIVFCRYVLGQMTEEAQRKVLEDLAYVLPPDGILVLGLDEAVAGLEGAFEPMPGRRGLFRRNPEFRAAAA
jgi:chemotaxis protein methyltransferase CheR